MLHELLGRGVDGDDGFGATCPTALGIYRLGRTAQGRKPGPLGPGVSSVPHRHNASVRHVPRLPLVRWFVRLGRRALGTGGVGGELRAAGAARFRRAPAFLWQMVGSSMELLGWVALSIESSPSLSSSHVLL